jgi:predicted dehydrogenase
MSSKETVRAAVIGVGAMGKNHARVYADMPEVSLVGVADTVEGVADEVVPADAGSRETRCGDACSANRRSSGGRI